MSEQSISINNDMLSEPLSVTLDTNVDTIALLCQLIVFGVDTALFEAHQMDDIMNVYETLAYSLTEFATPFASEE